MTHPRKPEDRLKARTAAFESLVQSHQSQAFALAFRFLGDEADAKDAVQESFIAIWKHFHEYDPNRKFSTWMYTIITRRCYDRIRERKRRNVHPFDEHEHADALPDKGNTEERFSNEELGKIIAFLAGELSPKQRIVFTLRDLQDLSLEEVSNITGLSEGSVKTNLHYARRHIRTVLARRYKITKAEL